jgi:glutathione S-transferase
MLRVWGRRSSFNVQKVMWLIGEPGLAHEHIDAGGGFGTLDTPDFLAMNPHGRIPVIRDGDVIVWESHAILRLSGGTPWRGTILARRSGCPRAGSTAGWTGRIRRYSRTSWSACSGDFTGCRKTSETGRRSTPRWRCANDFAKLDRLLEGRTFLLGEALTLADITAGTSPYRYFELEIERPPLLQVEHWYRALREREPFRTHIMIPFEELRGRFHD